MVEFLLSNHLAIFVAVAGLACMGTLAIAGGLVGGRGAKWLVLGSVALLLLAGRWPTVLMPGEMNVDESLMLAQALKFTADPMPWRAMDTGTGGPLNSYALLPLHWLGMPLGYPLARWTAIACLAAYLGLMFLAMRRLAGVRAAAIAVLPAAVMHAAAANYDGTHYSSEMASLAAIGLLAYTTSCIAEAGLTRRQELARAYVAGLCAFLVTMAKLQGVPLAAVLALAVLTISAPDLAAFARRLASMAAGAATGVLALVAVLAAFGLLADFRVSFLELPFSYATAPLAYGRLPEFLRMSPEAYRYVLGSGGAIGAGLLACWWWLRDETLPRVAVRVAFFALLLAAAAYTLTKPGRMFPHYLAYVTAAGCMLWLLVLPWEREAPRAATRTRKPSGSPRIQNLLCATAAVATVVLLLVGRSSQAWDRRPVYPYADAGRDHWVYALLEQLASPDDRLAIWGWSAKHWVYSGLVPATRESSSEFAMRDWGRGYYRARYLEAIRTRPPEFFIEAAGPNQFLFTDRAKVGMSMLPGLASLIESRYTRLHDDASNGLYMRDDAFSACCVRPAGAWSRVDAAPVRTSPPRPGMPAMSFADPRAGDAGDLVFPLHARHAFSHAIVPVMRTGMQRPGDLLAEDAEGRRLDKGCRKPLARAIAGWPEICILDLTHAPAARIRARGGVAVGEPILVRAGANR